MGIRRIIQQQGRSIQTPLGNGNIKAAQYQESSHVGGLCNNYSMMVERISLKNEMLSQITKRVEKNLQYLGEVTFNHILRENNCIVDMLI